jgi:hypothetical protein
MGAALGLAVMLVLVVAVLSMAANSQGGPFQAAPARRAADTGATRSAPGADRAEESSGQAEHPGGSDLRGTSSFPSYKPSRRPLREKPPEAVAAEAPPVEPQPAEPEPVPALASEAKPLGSEAIARVMSVVDERQLGPVTKSRLTLRVEPQGSDPFEVVARVAFLSPEERSRVKVGSTVPVRYDPEDHRRVVVQVGKDKP